jgi:hypothetical protein
MPYIGRVAPVSEAVIMHHATPRKRKLLEQASKSLESKPPCHADAAVRMFLKDDKYHSWKQVVPRCIQYRSKRYALPLACYLHPIEQMVYGWNDLSGTPIFAKCRNLTQRGNDIAAKMDFFFDPVAVSLDHSKFDAHVNMQLLDLEHWFYKQCNRSKLLAQLLHWQRLNRGSTKNGTKFVTRATRMSGDQNTGLGNSIINFAMTEALMAGIKHCLYIDGDDFIVFVERADAKYVDPKGYLQFGMHTKLDSQTSVIEHIEFCQTRPVFNGSGYTMVRNPQRMLKRVQWGVVKFHPSYTPKYLASVGRCLMSIGFGLPVEAYVGAKLAKLSTVNVLTPYTMMANKMPMRPLRAFLVEPSSLTRLSYETAWGLSPAQQQELESRAITQSEFVEDLCPFPEYGKDEQVIEAEWPSPCTS